MKKIFLLLHNFSRLILPKRVKQLCFRILLQTNIFFFSNIIHILRTFCSMNFWLHLKCIYLANNLHYRHFTFDQISLQCNNFSKRFLHCKWISLHALRITEQQLWFLFSFYFYVCLRNNAFPEEENLISFLYFRKNTGKLSVYLKHFFFLVTWKSYQVHPCELIQT